MGEPDQSIQSARKSDIEAMKACIQHARNLLDSARAVQIAGHPSIAFHLGVLALEELGRRELIGLQRIAQTRPAGPEWHKHTLAHTKKIFWCFFGMQFFSGPLMQQHFDDLKKFSDTLHLHRMASLYVNYEGDELQIPSEAIEPEYCSQLLNLVSSQIEASAAEKLREKVTQEDIDLQMWFLSVTDKPENKQVIFSHASFERLAELKDAKAWMLWLKEQFAIAKAETKRQFELEMERSRSLPERGTRDKWKLRIRIVSQSHSVRQKPLNAWNKTSSWVKLFAVSGKPNQLIIEFTFKDNMPLAALWYFGWGVARHFVAALNLATMGFWWWRMPEDIDSYYEGVEDLENKARIGIQRTPSLKVDWGGNRILSQDELARVSACCISLPRPEHRDQHKPYNHYVRGLTLLSLNDVHFQCEVQAFGDFFESLKAMMEEMGEAPASEPFLPKLHAFLSETFPDMDEHEHFGAIFQAIEAKDTSNVVTLRDAAMMKMFCDAYFLRKVVPRATQNLRHPSVTEPVPE